MSDSKEIRDYLLGSLPPERMEEIEKRILTDDAFHQEVEIMEEELLDRYAQGRISGTERLLFDRHFLASPVRKQRLEFARALQTKIDSMQTTPGPVSVRFSAIYPYALAACTFALVVLGIATYRLSMRLQEQRVADEQVSRQNEEMRKTIAAMSASQDLALQPLIVAELTPGGSRESKLAKINVPRGIRAVQFELKVPQSLQGDTIVALLDDSGQLITTVRATQPQKLGADNIVVAVLAEEFLKKGNYFLRLTQPPATKLLYSFQIVP